MTFSSLPLSYCTNAHPGLTLDAVLDGLKRYTARIQSRTNFPVAAGLWLANPVVEEIDVSAVERLRNCLQDLSLSCYTLNAFPYGNFHADRVKENVYLPDWSQPERISYTLRCAHVLAQLLPEKAEGSISTVPLGFKEFDHAAEFETECIAALIRLAVDLDQLRQTTGKTIRLAIEPEPFCLLETTDETLTFFDKLRNLAAGKNWLEVVEEHIGICYDVCHQAVEFEDVEESIRALDEASIRINKVHITCAIELRDPAANSAAREVLARYAEPRYLHQTMSLSSSGSVSRFVDLTPEFALHPPADFAAADVWRVHFHVPVDAETLGPLGTTRDELRRALTAVAKLDYAPHLEVETYTWEVLPDQPATTDLVDGLARELSATQVLIGEVQASSNS